nr:MAG TPA: hypothetical protein [Caudoviricetes sp.]
MKLSPILTFNCCFAFFNYLFIYLNLILIVSS